MKNRIMPWLLAGTMMLAVPGAVLAGEDSIEESGTLLEETVDGEAGDEIVWDAFADEAEAETDEDLISDSLISEADDIDPDADVSDGLIEEAADTFADEDPVDDGGTHISVVDLGADGTDTEDDSAAFNAAFAKAKDSSETIYVTIPAGTYYLESSIYVYSNTVVDATGATVIGELADGPMVNFAHVDENGKYCGNSSSCKHGGYTQAHDISFTGGVWNRNSDSTTDTAVFRCMHGDNISFTDMTFMRATNHFVNVSGSRNVTVDGCTFADHVDYTGDESAYWDHYDVGDKTRYSTIEVLHLDFTNMAGETQAYPIDNTPVQNVLVQNCTFSNVYSGVGTHHVNASARATNVVIKNNVFKNVHFAGISGTSFDGFVVSGNTFTGNAADKEPRLLNASDCNMNVTDNTATGAYRAMHIKENTAGTIANNTITGSTENGIALYSGCDLTVSGNHITDSAKSGIYCSQLTKAVVTNNEIRNAGEAGVYMREMAGSVEGNVIDGALNGILLQQCASTINVNKNTVRNAGSIGIYANGTAFAVNSNNIDTITKAGCYFTASSGTVTANKISNVENGIQLASDCDVTAKQNTIGNTTKIGIVVNGTATKATVSENTIATAGTTGIYVKSNQPCTVSCNKVTAKGYALQAEGTATAKTAVDFIGNVVKTGNTNSAAIRLSSYCANCRILNNVYNGKGISAATDAVYTASGNVPFCTAPKITKIENASTGVKVTWGSVTKEKIIYRVFRKTSTTSWAKVGDVYTTTFTDTKAVSGTAYQYTVRCVSPDKKNYISTYDTAGKAIYYLKSLKPAVANTTTGVRIAWTKVAGASGYFVYRKSGTGSYVKIKAITSQATVAYIDTTAVSGTTYTYAVRAVKGSYAGYFTGVSIKFLKSITPVLANTTAGIKISWAKVTGATGYVIYRKTGTGSFAKIATISGGTKVTYTDTAVRTKKNVSFTYAVRAMSGTTLGYFTARTLVRK